MACILTVALAIGLVSSTLGAWDCINFGWGLSYYQPPLRKPVIVLPLFLKIPRATHLPLLKSLRVVHLFIVHCSCFMFPCRSLVLYTKVSPPAYLYPNGKLHRWIFVCCGFGMGGKLVELKRLSISFNFLWAGRDGTQVLTTFTLQLYVPWRIK